jgi:hypothetical protein
LRAINSNSFNAGHVVKWSADPLARASDDASAGGGFVFCHGSADLQFWLRAAGAERRYPCGRSFIATISPCMFLTSSFDIVSHAYIEHTSALTE